MRYAFCIFIVLLCTEAWGQTGATTQERNLFRFEALPRTLQRRVDDQRRMLEFAGIGKPGESPRGVLNAWKIWTPDITAIKVCFFSGSRELRVRIAKIALQWKAVAPGIPLDFGEENNPRPCNTSEIDHIRIGFAYRGYWSLVGQDGLRLALQSEQSMNFESFDTAPPNENEFQSTVLHEFGHALGLHHEHQNPLGKCAAEFDWPKIYAFLAAPPNSWPKEETDRQMQLTNEPGLYATKLDKDSIMLYTFPASFFKKVENSTCFSQPHITLSAGDKTLISELYATDPAVRWGLIAKIREFQLAQLEKSGAVADTKSAVLATLNQYMPAPKQ